MNETQTGKKVECKKSGKPLKETRRGERVTQGVDKN